MIKDWNDIKEVSETVLSYLPQQKPFRFVDQIIEIDDNHCVGTYQFAEDEYFYQGHFPGKPVTPGVILVESMAQVGVCSLSIFLFLKESRKDFSNFTTYFTETNAEFMKPVLPGDKVIIKAKKVYWRRNKVKSEASMFLENGDLVAHAELAGMGVVE